MLVLSKLADFAQDTQPQYPFHPKSPPPWVCHYPSWSLPKVTACYPILPSLTHTLENTPNKGRLLLGFLAQDKRESEHTQSKPNNSTERNRPVTGSAFPKMLTKRSEDLKFNPGSQKWFEEVFFLICSSKGNWGWGVVIRGQTDPIRQLGLTIKTQANQSTGRQQKFRNSTKALTIKNGGICFP